MCDETPNVAKDQLEDGDIGSILLFEKEGLERLDIKEICPTFSNC